MDRYAWSRFNNGMNLGSATGIWNSGLLGLCDAGQALCLEDLLSAIEQTEGRRERGSDMRGIHPESVPLRACLLIGPESRFQL